MTAPRGRTRGVYISINGVDDFLPRRAEARVTCSHLDIDPASDITLGRLRSGRLRVAIAVPPDAELADAELAVEVPPWVGRAGGRKGPLHFVCPFRVIDPATSGRGRSEASQGTHAAGSDRVALVWTSHETEEGWTSQTVGDVERIDADSLAQAASDYAALAGQHFEVLVVKLNEEFAPLKSYAALRAQEVGDEGVARAKDRYAVGVGVDMLLLDEQATAMSDRLRTVDDEWIDIARTAAARGVLAVMPDYDQLVAEAGLEGV